MVVRKMGENLLAGIADAYWYEWYVGLEKVLDLLNPDSNVIGVTLQASQQQGLDDVVVKYVDKKLECIQVKHTRKDSSLTYTFLFCEHTENGKTKPACIREYSDDWKRIKDQYRQCTPIMYTNREIGNQTYTPPNGKGYRRPALKKFWTELKKELNVAESISDIQFSDMVNNSMLSMCELGKMYKTAFDNILKKMPGLSDAEKLIFLKEFQIYSDENNDLDNIKKLVSNKLARLLKVDIRQCENYHNRLLRGLTDWTISTRSQEEITKEQVRTILSLKKDELVGEHYFATEEPFFESRKQWIVDLENEILLANKGVFFISGEPGAGKTNIISYIANKNDSIIASRFHAFKPIQVEYDVMPADEGLYSPEDFWKNTLIQIRDKFEGCMEEYNVPVAVEAFHSIDALKREVLRLAQCLYEKTGKSTVIAVDGIDHAARAGRKNTFLSTLPSPSRLPKGVVFILAGQPYSNNADYPLWIRGDEVIAKTVPPLITDDIEQLLLKDNVVFDDASISEIAEYILTVTKGNTLSVMYAVYDARCHYSICNYEKYITERKLANGIDAYYDYIWNSALEKWSDQYIHVEIVLSGIMTLINRGITLQLLQSLIKDSIIITDVQLAIWLQCLEPLIIKNDKGAYAAYINDVRLFLIKRFEAAGESRRLVASRICDYILIENTNIALKHDSLFKSLLMADRRKEIPEYFNAKYAYEAILMHCPLIELEDQTYLVLETLAEGGDLNYLVDVSCAIGTITQYQNSIFSDEDCIYNVDTPLPCETKALSSSLMSVSDLFNALVQVKQLLEAGYEDRAKGAFKRWIANRTPGQIGNKYASDEDKKHHYNFNDTLKKTLQMYGKLCFKVGKRFSADEDLIEGDEDSEAFFSQGVFEACKENITIATMNRMHHLIKCYWPNDYYKFTDELLINGQKETIDYFVEHCSQNITGSLQSIVLYLYALALGNSTMECPDLERINAHENTYLEFLYKIWAYAFCDIDKCIHLADEGIDKFKDNQGKPYEWRFLVSEILFVNDLYVMANGGDTSMSDEDFSRYVGCIIRGESSIDVGVEIKIRDFRQHLMIVMLIILDKMDEKYKLLALPILEKRMKNSCWLIENLWEFVLKYEKNPGILKEIYDLWMIPKGKVWKMSQEEIKDCATRFIKMGNRMGWTERCQKSQKLLDAKRIMGYSSHKEYGGYNLLRWYEDLSSNNPYIWETLGVQLLNISGVISETGDNRAEVYMEAAVASSAGRCGIGDIIRFSHIPNNRDNQWCQTVFDAVIAYLESSEDSKENLLELWEGVCVVFPILAGSLYNNNINAIYREDLKKAILANANKRGIVIEKDMKEIRPECYEQRCELRNSYKIPQRWFDEDDIMTDGESLQEYLEKISQQSTIGSNEWRSIISLLKEAVRNGENIEAELIFSLILQRPKDYANWEWDGVQDLIVELIPFLSDDSIRRLLQDIIERNRENQKRFSRRLNFFYPNMDMEYLVYAYNRNFDFEKRVEQYLKILNTHEMWTTANGMIEKPVLFSLKNSKEENYSMQMLIDRVSEFPASWLC